MRSFNVAYLIQKLEASLESDDIHGVILDLVHTLKIEKQEKDLCEFGIVKKKCYFCDQPRTIRFNEHYTFCPNCSSIYSTQILQESHCKHFSDDSAIVVEFEPLFYPAKKPYVVGKDICSECGANVWADGW